MTIKLGIGKLKIEPPYNPLILDMIGCNLKYFK